MAKFTYRMQNILEIKRKLESQAKIAYMIANGKLQDEQEKLQKILLTKASYENKARTLEQGKLDVRSIREYHLAIDEMKERQKIQIVNVQAAERNVEIARDNLNQVMIDRKTHEKLREKAFDEFKQELAHAESKEVDEMVSYSYHEVG
jgi:flagellar FliJ protein